MDNQDNKTQNQGFELSGETSSKKNDVPNEETGNSYQFETTTTATHVEEPIIADNSNKRSNIGLQQSLPNSGGILAMGIISIALFCCCYGFIGVTLGIIAIILASSANKTYWENPELFTESSYKNMRAGRICAIIGLSLAAIFVIISIIGFVGGYEMMNLSESIEEINEIFEETGY